MEKKMSADKAASLSSQLIVRKGEAAPSVGGSEKEDKKFLNNLDNKSIKKKSGTIAVTLRLDPYRYERLKLYGVKERLTNQDIIVFALDSYLDVNDK